MDKIAVFDLLMKTRVTILGVLFLVTPLLYWLGWIIHIKTGMRSEDTDKNLETEDAEEKT